MNCNKITSKKFQLLQKKSKPFVHNRIVLLYRT